VAIVAFKDLHKLASRSQQENTRKELFARLQDKPFWIWDKEQHKQDDIRTDGDCCFNHVIDAVGNSYLIYNIPLAGRCFVYTQVDTV
jgi:hypothetical protein